MQMRVAAQLMRDLIRVPKCIDLLSLPAYSQVLKKQKFTA